MDKKKMLNELIRHFAKGNKTLFAKIIGKSPQSVCTWLSRSTFDAEYIYSKCNSVSAHWLLTGEGDMLSSSSTITQNGNGSAASINGNATVTNSDYQHLEERITLLERLLEEKERTIKILMSQHPL